MGLVESVRNMMWLNRAKDGSYVRGSACETMRTLRTGKVVGEYAPAAAGLGMLGFDVMQRLNPVMAAVLTFPNGAEIVGTVLLGISASVKLLERSAQKVSDDYLSKLNTPKNPVIPPAGTPAGLPDTSTVGAGAPAAVPAVDDLFAMPAPPPQAAAATKADKGPVVAPPPPKPVAPPPPKPAVPAAAPVIETKAEKAARLRREAEALEHEDLPFEATRPSGPFVAAPDSSIPVSLSSRDIEIGSAPASAPRGPVAEEDDDERATKPFVKPAMFAAPAAPARPAVPPPPAPAPALPTPREPLLPPVAGAKKGNRADLPTRIQPARSTDVALSATDDHVALLASKNAQVKKLVDQGKKAELIALLEDDSVDLNVDSALIVAAYNQLKRRG